MVNSFRLAKYIASSGLYSRKEAEKLIIANLVKVNGKTFNEFVLFDDKSYIVEVNGQKITPLQEIEIYKFYKSSGTVTSTTGPQNRFTIFDVINKNYNYPNTLKAVGRLDFNTEGLLLLTSHGHIARELELPKNKFLRIYEVKIWGSFSLDLLKYNLEQGIQIEKVLYQPIKMSVISSKKNNHAINLTLNEGKNREIRKILSFFNFKIKSLKRVQFGPVKLHKMKKGELQKITPIEFNLIKQMLNSSLF